VVDDCSVVIAGGGTGGHLYPGIAVARELRRRLPAARVSFAGTARGLEARVVPKEGFELDVLRSAGLKGKSIGARLRGAALVPVGLFDAWRILSRRRPRVVIGVGGYSSGPVVLAAALRGIPTMVLEQNAMPGLTNRLLARVVRAAAITYDETRAYFGAKAFVSGNPVRAEFFTPRADGPAPDEPPCLLILGGSQGAHAVNLAVVAQASALLTAAPRLRIVHQTGERDRMHVAHEYERAGITARVEAFLEGVADEMRAATLVICRAGATTLAELAATGRPAVIVPLPTATDDHQRRNARVLAAAGAAIAVEERELGEGGLARLVAGLLANPARRREMSAAVRTFAKPDAAATIAARVQELAG
jgi:UDP-N-acetylglucosamine--N-acetylmuramyl-(pentapeptide) pyrophosphoryl-undecaprenol N-acetylglucosamine transferase